VGRRARPVPAWLERFYDLVEEDDSLAPVFGGIVSREHRDHVLDWWCEVTSAWAAAAIPSQVISATAARVAAMRQAERAAVDNSQPGAAVAEHAPVPRWGWSVAPPYQP
jgi:hemoglobin